MKVAASHDCATKPVIYDWVSVERSLAAHGNAVLPGLLTVQQGVISQDQAFAQPSAPSSKSGGDEFVTL